VSGGLEETKSKPGKGKKKMWLRCGGRGGCVWAEAEGRRHQIQGGAAGWFVSVNGSGAAGFEERKSKPGGGRLFGLDMFRVRFAFFFFFLYFSFKIFPSYASVENSYL